MKENTLRYTGPATVKMSYMNEFIVRCPKCAKNALVSVENQCRSKEGRLVCSHCSYTEKTSDQIRYNAIVKRNCDNCGKGFEVKIPNQKTKQKEITIPCPNCGITRKFKARIEEYRLKHPVAGEACDPIFNLPLWFQAEIKGKVFWAYNRAHLSEIKKYVQAKLRERQTLYYTTMVERLPQFITEAKNREVVLKGIERLERKY